MKKKTVALEQFHHWKHPRALVAVIALMLLFGVWAIFLSDVHLFPETWSGEVRITKDVFFMPWATLTIEPGTRVLFEKLPDIPATPWTTYADAYIKDHNDPTGHTGYNQSHFEITAHVNAVGTTEQPIMFTSAQQKPEYADWDQLVLLSGSILDHVEVAYTHNGINVEGDNIKINNTVSHEALWSCIDSFGDNITIENSEAYNCWHQAIGTKNPKKVVLRNNYIHDVQVGVNCEDDAHPSISNNRIERAGVSESCPIGEWNRVIEGTPNTAGGTYNGKLIYPSS